MHVAQLEGILSVSSQVLGRLACLPSTRLQLRPTRSFYKYSAPYVQISSHCNRTCVIGGQSGLRGFASTSWNSINMENGYVRKRKESPVDIPGRPAKLFKSDTLHSDQSIDSPFMYASDGTEDAMVEPTTAMGENPEWQATIEQVVKNVVSIHFCQTCPFDTSPALSSEATGFVVDATKGYILTNRHVVGSAPFSGHCIFDNHEEVSPSLKYHAMTC